MNYLEHLKKNKIEFFQYLKENYPLFTNSNIFFRDIEYAIKYYFRNLGKELSSGELNKITTEFVSFLENENDLKRFDKKTWKVLNSFFLIESKVKKEEEVS